MNTLSWSYGRLRARLVLLLAAIGLVMGLHAVAPSRAHAMDNQCDVTSDDCEDGGGSGGGGYGGLDGNRGDTDGGGYTSGTGASNSDPVGSGNTGGGIWGDPMDPTGWAGTDPDFDPNQGHGGVVECDGAFDCTITDENGVPHELGDPRYDRVPNEDPATGDLIPETGPDVGDPIPVISPLDKLGKDLNDVRENCRDYLDMANSVVEAGGHGTDPKVQSLLWHYDVCKASGGWNNVTSVDPSPDPTPTGATTAATVSARKATAAGKQTHAANLAARTATQAATKAAAKAGQQAGRISAKRTPAKPKAKRHAKKRRG
jgi:hypothetical protein